MLYFLSKNFYGHYLHRLGGIAFAIILYLFSYSAFANLITIEILGVNPEIKEKILQNLSIKPQENETANTEDNIQVLYEQSICDIQSILEVLGYYQARIQANLYASKTGYTALYHIHLGKPVIIRSVEVRIEGSGKCHPEFAAHLTKCPLKIGDLLNHTAYDNFKQSLLADVLQQGYLDAMYVKSCVRVDIERSLADISLVLDTGTRYAFGEVNFINPPYPCNYLRKYIPYCSGEPYTTEQLICFQRILTQSNLFNKVRIDPMLSHTENFLVPVQVFLEPKPHNKYTASVGFGTDTGLRSMAGWERKRLHYPGHKIHLNGKVSEKRNQMNLEYSFPGEKPATDTVRLTARVIEEKFYKKLSMRSKLGASYNMMLLPTVEQILAIHYLSSVDRILPTDPKIRTHFLMPSVGYVWSDMKKTMSLLPYGFRISTTIRAGLESILSTTSLIQTDCRVKWIYPISDLSRLILRHDFGVISAGDRDDIPLTLRYFTGGDQTVRGYGYRSLGPTEIDAYGEPIVVGGKYLFVGSIEIDHVIYKNISLAAFVDSGNAMNKLSARLATGVGLGLRWGTPLGPFRFDFAQGLNNKKFNPRIHITFGMDF